MKGRLIYLPLERYQERYTEFLSGEDGMFERQCRALGVDVLAIRPHDFLGRITTGRVLDAKLRAQWGFSQTLRLIELIQKNAIDPSTDAIYIEDFWQPGFEMIPYTAHLCYAEALPIYAFCHAQSVDPNDFTFTMGPWMRPMEVGWSRALAGIFVAAEELRLMLLQGGVGSKDTVHATGTVFDASVLYDKYLPSYPGSYGQEPARSVRDRLKQVIFSSRWDSEKQPLFFLELIKSVMRDRNDIHFVICTGFSELRSNIDVLVREARATEVQFPSNLSILTDVTKSVYYEQLSRSKVQFNCALQDFVSYTLLEATAFGASPLYPKYLTFPDALHHKEKHLYHQFSLENAKAKLYALIDAPSEDYGWVYGKYQNSVHRMLRQMHFDVPNVLTLEYEIRRGKQLAAGG